MSRSAQYDAWNKKRRERFPDANHSAWSSEQCFDVSKGHELVADWRSEKSWILERTYED